MSSSTSSFTMLLKMLRAILESSEVFNYAQYFNVVKDIPVFNLLMKKSYNTLELFTFGSVSDYIFDMKNYLKLTPLAIAKLRVLTLVSLADMYDELDLAVVRIQLRTETKHEALDLLLKACQVGVITSSVDFSTEKVQFFSVRKRNTDTLLLERLVKVKTTIYDMIANRSTIFMLPLHHGFSDIVQRMVTTATNGGEEGGMNAEAELYDFIKSNAVKQNDAEVSAKKPKVESKSEKASAYYEQKHTEESAYDADEEKEKDEDYVQAEKQKKPKKKAKKYKYYY